MPCGRAARAGVRTERSPQMEEIGLMCPGLEIELVDADTDVVYQSVFSLEFSGLKARGRGVHAALKDNGRHLVGEQGR